MYNNNDYNSNNGFLTSIWGPLLWTYLHTVSFNYPLKPTEDQKDYHYTFIMSLRFTLPCKYCRDNMEKNLKKIPLTEKVFKNRHNFSYWMYLFHEEINKMLDKKSGLTYENVRDRYEHFRSRCSGKDLISKDSKEKGCITPLGKNKKNNCVVLIVPEEMYKKEINQSFIMSKECINKN